MADDPVLAARTVAEFFVAVDAMFGLDVPTEFPPDTSLGVMWALPVSVVKDPGVNVVYRATTTAPFPVTAALGGTVVIDIVNVAGAVRRRVSVSSNRKDRSWLPQPHESRPHRVAVPSSRRRPRP